MVIFGIEQKVGAHNCDAHRNYCKDEEDQQHEAVHVVHLVVPEGCEDEVHLNEDAAKGQQTTHK